MILKQLQSAAYQVPKVKYLRLNLSSHILQVSGSDIDYGDEGEEDDD